MLINFDDQFIKASLELENCLFVKSKQQLNNKHFNNAVGIIVRLGTVIDKNFLSRFKCLKFVATITTGLDHIDLDYCLENSIKVLSLKGHTDFLKGIRATPEHTWLLIQALARKIIPAFEDVKKGNWNRSDFYGNELFEKTLGILGFGRIGEIVAGYAKAFGMKVIAHDIIEIKNKNVDAVTMNHLFKNSDYLTIHLPLNKKTRDYVDIAKISLMKPTSFLINTSRGPIVKEDDLLKALTKKIIAGAALDVLSEENNFGFKVEENKIANYSRNADNLILTPHIAGSTLDSMHKTSDFILSEINYFIN